MKRHLTFMLTLALVVGSGFFAGTALAVNYIGSGQFPTGNLSWCHMGIYPTANANAIARWSATTDLNISNNCTSYQVITSTPDWGNNGYYGYAYICMGPYGCDTGVYEYPYTNCNAQSNTYYLAYWTGIERQFNATHELGHCWSLAHRGDPTSVMITGKHSITEPNPTDQFLINSRY